MEVLDLINKFEFFIFLIGLGWLFAAWIARKVKRVHAATRKMSIEARKRLPSDEPVVFPN